MPKINLQPLGDVVIIKQDEAEAQTPGGIVLPDQAQKKQRKGKVLAVGPGGFTDKGARIPIDVREGYRVIFSTFSGQEFEHEGEKYILARAQDILAYEK